MNEEVYRRRAFLSQMMKAGTAGIFISPVFRHLSFTETWTVSRIMDLILAEVPGGKLTDTVDTLKSGSGDQVVTGIITTMFCTVDIIRAAAKLDVNLIIAHEPTFYNHQDDLNFVPDNYVAKEKKELLEKNKITVWRFHDYWHRMKPDGILHGVLLNTGWLPYNPKEENIFEIPKTQMGTIVSHLIKSMHLPHVRYIGDMKQECSRIALFPGASGGQKQINALLNGRADILIVGESAEWETPEFVRDAIALGKQKSLIILGHDFSEEPGMEWLVSWLQPKLPGMPIKHIPSGETFSWIS